MMQAISTISIATEAPKHSNAVKDCLSKTWDVVSVTLKDVGAKVANFAKAAWAAIVAFGKKIWPRIIKAYAVIKDSYLVPAWQATKAFAHTYFEKLKAFYIENPTRGNLIGAVILTVAAVTIAFSCIFSKCRAKRNHAKAREIFNRESEKRRLLKDETTALRKKIFRQTLNNKIDELAKVDNIDDFCKLRDNLYNEILTLSLHKSDDVKEEIEKSIKMNALLKFKDYLKPLQPSYGTSKNLEANKKLKADINRLVTSLKSSV